MDIWEAEKQWTVTADLPGVQDEDVQVEVAENHLIIRGKRNFTTQPGGRTTQAERGWGRFCRTFLLPENVQRDAIRAEFKRGVLTVILPRDHDHEIRALKIDVRST
jgi:HSP20 family protein